MADPLFPPGLPGVPTGNQTPPVVATKDPTGASVRPPVAASTSVPLFGGHRGGGKRRADGLAAGSPEALEVDREKNRKRMEQKRATERAATPAALPSAAPGSVPSAQGASDAPAGNVGDSAFVALDGWTAADLAGVVNDGIPLAELWRVNEFTRVAVEGKLPEAVVKKVAGDAKFPESSKVSLRSSLPGLLAKAFNQFGVPLALKSMIVGFPVIGYLVIRDMQNMAELRKLIAEEQSRKPAPAVTSPAKP